MPKEKLTLDHDLIIKKKKKNKIIAFSILAITLILAVLIIVGACVPVNLKPNVIENPNRIAVYNKTSNFGEFASDQEEYREFMTHFDSMFESSYLVSLFSGRLGDYVIEEPQENVYLSEVKSEILQQGYYVEFKYDEPQILTYSDGKLYYSIFDKNKTLSFTSVYFAISENNELTTMDIYISIKYSNSSDAKDTIIKVSQKANSYILYENIQDFKTFN